MPIAPGVPSTSPPANNPVNGAGILLPIFGKATPGPIDVPFRELPKGTQGIPVNTTPGGQIVPSSGGIVPADTPPDPCKSQDPCISSIKDIVKSSDVINKASAGVSAAILAAVTPIPVQVKTFLLCNAETPVFNTETVLIPAGSILYVQKLFEKIANIEGQKCKECDLSLAVPEWWQLPVENFRPQLIISYRVLNTDGTLGGTTYSVTLPHPKPEFSTKPLTKPSMPAYKKGNYQGILRLKDNSAIIVNAKDTTSVESLMTGLKALIDPQKLTDKSYKTVIHPPGTFNEANLKPWRLDYFPTGRGGTTSKGLKPAWSWKL
jgi:hypothetical protein